MTVPASMPPSDDARAAFGTVGRPQRQEARRVGYSKA